MRVLAVKNKTIFCLLLCFFVFPSGILAVPSASIYFEPQTASSFVNRSFILKLKINPGVNRITATEVYLEFDRERLKLNAVNPSSSFNVILQPAKIDNNQGRASIVLGAPPTAPVSTVVELLSLDFTAKSTGQGKVVILPQTGAVAINETGNVIGSYGWPAGILINPSSSVVPTPTISSPLKPSLPPNKSPVIQVSPNSVPGEVPKPGSGLPPRSEVDPFPNLRRYLKNYSVTYKQASGTEKDLSPSSLHRFIEFIKKLLGNISGLGRQFFKTLFER